MPLALFVPLDPVVNLFCVTDKLKKSRNQESLGQRVLSSFQPNEEEEGGFRQGNGVVRSG
jgi:hypothetical protein